MRLFLGYAVIELVALLVAVSWLGFGATLLVLMGGLLIGMALVRHEGSRTALALAEALRDGRMARDELTDGALIGLGGLLIMIPGLVSDLLGLLLVLPPTRRLIRRWPARRPARWAPRDGSGAAVDPEGLRRSPGGGMVIEGEVLDSSVRRSDGRPGAG
jgi:UPF0716 protein FxsA